MKIKTKKRLLILVLIISMIACIFVIFAIVPPEKAMEDNPFIIEENARPMIAAHRGGGGINPENTFMAFDYATNECNADILELDTCMTKDDNLVVIHNLTLNSSTDINVIEGNDNDHYVNDYTLSDLQKLNFGYNFNTNDMYSYRSLLDDVKEEDKSTKLLEKGLRIVTIPELFSKYEETDIMFIIEIKNSGDLGLKATDLLASFIKQYHMERRVVIGTFHNEVEEKLGKDYPELIRGASTKAVAKFVITQMLGVNIFDKTNFACLQLPTEYEVKGLMIKLDKQNYIKRAHRRNISVQYWTINDKEEMRYLINLGADVIMTDRPDIMKSLLEEMTFTK